MIQARTWSVRAMYILIAAALAISLFITAAPAQKVSANPGLSEWDKVSTPTVQGFVLAPESAIYDFAVGANGTVAYAIVYSSYNYSCGGCVGCNPEGEGPYYLLKSTDSAATWKSITKGIKAEITKKNLGDINNISQVACDADNPDFVAVALWVSADGLHVFISNDGGSTFRDTGEVDLYDVYALEVSPAVDNVHDIAIGGAGGGEGKIFRNQAIGGIGTGWVDTSNTALYPGWQPCYYVVDIQFSPSWSTDHGILAVTFSNSYDVYLQTGIWGDTEAWNYDAIDVNAVYVTTTYSFYYGAGITLPTDYKATDKTRRYAWVWVNYDEYSGNGGGGGVIYRVKYPTTVATTVTAIGMQIEGYPWLTNVSYLGTIASGVAIAGLVDRADGDEYCAAVQVYRKSDITDMDTCPTCIPWEPACKPPTGVYAMAAFFVSPTKAYAVALGPFLQYPYAYDEGAWSVSWGDNTTDIGDVWNQLSLIDTSIDYLSDVTVSPDCNKMWLVSINNNGEREGSGCDSVWLKATDLPEAAEYSGQWLRTWSGQLENGWGMLRLPPDGITGNLTADEIAGETVYLVDYDTNTVYWNTVETLACWDECTATKLSGIVDLAVKDESTVYALASDGMVAMADEYACNWHTPVDSLICGNTIAVNGDYVLVGGTGDSAGQVSYSDDGGATFTVISEKTPIEGDVTVAFDSYFDENNVIYAAVNDDWETGGIYRWVIGESTEWKDIGAEHYAYTGLVLSNADGNPFTTKDTGGVLYASYVAGYQYYDDEYTYTGVARCLTPAAEISCEKCIEWDYLIVGLTEDECFEATPDALKICGCLTPDSSSKLYAIDSCGDYDMCKGEDGTVWTFEDCYAKKAPDLTSPIDGFLVPASCYYCDNMPFTLKWAAVCDACFYDVQIALDQDFTELVVDETTQKAGLSYLVSGMLTSEVTYYWRVRAHEAGTGQIIHSWWSDAQSNARSITVAPASGAGVNLITPNADATDVARTKVAFTWSKTASAKNYDWVLSKNADLSSPVETKTGLNSTAYTCTKTLDYDTPYYWQVTAYNADGAAVSMSTIGTFRTAAEIVTPPPVTTPTPFWVWVVIAIGAVLVIVVIVLIFRTRRV